MSITNQNNNKTSKKIYLIIFLTSLIICIVVSGVLGFRAYNLNRIYKSAYSEFISKNYEEAKEIFSTIENYKDADEYIKECTYQLAISDYNKENYEKAILGFKTIREYKYSKNYIKKCQYGKAISDYHSKNYQSAISAFEKLKDFEDSEAYLEKAMLGRKYAAFTNKNPYGEENREKVWTYDGTDWKYDYENRFIQTANIAEDIIDSLYGVLWYNHSTGETLEISEYKIGERYYGIICIEDTPYDEYFCSFIYLDEPNNINKITFGSGYDYFFEYIGDKVEVFYLHDNDALSKSTYYSVPKDVYDEYVSMEEWLFSAYLW